MAEEQAQEEELRYPYAVRGARIYCSFGSHIRKLDMPASHGAKIRDKAMLHEQDCKVGIDQNIAPFGACYSPENAEIEIEISDAKDLVPMGDENGNPIEATLPIVGKLCVPQLGDKWLNAQEETLVDGKPAITVQCTVACKYGGVISFIDDGQEV